MSDSITQCRVMGDSITQCCVMGQQKQIVDQVAVLVDVVDQQSR